jgi:hypothetical protein
LCYNEQEKQTKELAVRRWHAALVVLLPLSLLMLTCGRTNPEQASVTATLRPTFTPAAAGAPPVTDTPEPQDAVGTHELELGSLWEPNDATSVRINQSLRVSGTEAGETVNAVSDVFVEFTIEPRALHTAARSQGTILGTEFDLEAYQVGDVTYYRLDDEWSRDRPFDKDLYSANSVEFQLFLPANCGWRRQGNAEYEGIPVEHWTLSTDDLLACKSAEEMAEIGVVTAASGNAMIIPGGSDFVHVDLVLEGTELKTGIGTGQVLDEGRVEFVYEISGLNQPLAIEVPGEALAAKGPLNLEGLALPSELTSYRGSLRYNVWGVVASEIVDGTLEHFVEYTSEPQAQHVQGAAWAMDGNETEASDVYQFADSTYTRLDQGWEIRPTTEEIVPQTSMFDPRDLLEGTCGWKQQTDVEYRGVLAHHWTMATEDSLDCQGVELLETGNATAFSGELFIAAEGNYTLHLELILEATELDFWLGGPDEKLLDEGRVVILLDMVDVNQPFTIQPPEEGLSYEALPQDLPIPDGAQELSHIGHVVIYSIAQTAGEVRDYFARQMPDEGWTEGRAEETPYGFRFSFSKDSRTVHLAIGREEESGLTKVLIFFE